MTPPVAAAVAAPAVRRARTAAPTRTVAPTRAPRPRRVSGPARRGQTTTRPNSAEQPKGLALGVLAALRSVDGSPLLERLIRGRTWIGLVAFALIGIVTLQLLLLQLNAGIGRSLARQSTLERQNAALTIENSERASGNLVESSAAARGMEIVPASSLRFLSPRPSVDAARAAAALNTPVTPSSSATAGTATEPTTAAAGAQTEAAGSASGEASQSAAASTGEAGSAATGTPATTGTASTSGSTDTATGGETTSSPAATAAPTTPASSSTGAGVAHVGEAPAGSGQSVTTSTPAGGTQAQAGPAG